MTPLLWIIAAGVLGFLVSAIFAGWLRLPRTVFLVPYVLIIGAFLYAYARWHGVDVGALLVYRWLWGLLAAVVVGAILVRNVIAQPSSPRSEGIALAVELAWWGGVYGAVDGLLLSVMPVLATRQVFADVVWSTTWYGQILVGVLALLASSYVTAAYHLGYPEFRSSKVMLPVAGNTLMSLGYLLTQAPLAAFGAHAIMHIAAVLHGTRYTVQLPPHIGATASERLHGV